ncbi:thermonuclease family protein [Denitrobaculum tricleocarpae]|uniref:Nuclease n=1 Tax=Denitrobaculum tricleocarpae TaxID=2591009 RepID=A0A545TKH7_9PROT|nr:hypothetical protein [Denitrobaculum tricleocarpae]TQV77732.1 hypothetical protein FKG95_19400 [Denitrobaculum tricleocarpae]
MRYKTLHTSFTLGAVLLLLSATPSLSNGLSVPADVIAIYESDTVLVDAYPWPGMTLRVVVRLASLDVPRTPGQCQAESKRAAAARRFTERRIGSLISLNGVRDGDDAGSVRANISTQEGMDLAQLLIQSNFARPHDGGESKGWCRN